MAWWTKYTEVEVELAIANALAGGTVDLSGTSNTQLLFNDSGTIGGDSTITIEGTPTALVVKNTGSAFGSLAIANNDQSFPFWDSGTGLSVLQNAADPTFDYNSFLVFTVVDANKTVSSTISELRLSQSYNFASGFLEANVSSIGDAGFDSTSQAIIAYYGLITLDGTVTTDFVAAVYAASIISSHALSAPLVSFYSTPTVNFGASASAVFGAYLKAPLLSGGAGGTVTWYNGVWQEAAGGTATNAYSFWHDEAGVFRIKADNTFNSVYQAILALYNPQFAKYTPGAVDHERIIMGQWNSNVAEIGTEKGGTGTLRKLRLIGAGLLLDATILPTSNPGAGQLWNDNNTVKVGT